MYDVSIHRNVSLPGMDGARQIDVLITSKVAGIEIKTIVECKDYNKKVDVKVIDGFHSVMQDVGAHKGVVVSRKGFSSTAIKKAKRLGISLFTAHKACSDKWNIDFKLPILLTEVYPAKITVNPTVSVKKGTMILRSALHTINDINLVKSFMQNWNNDSALIDSHLIFENDSISLKINNISAPFFIRDSKGMKLPVSDYDLMVGFEKKYYLGFLDEIDESMVLQSHSEDDSTMILSSDVFTMYGDKLKVSVY